MAKIAVGSSSENGYDSRPFNLSDRVVGIDVPRYPLGRSSDRTTMKTRLTNFPRPGDEMSHTHLGDDPGLILRRPPDVLGRAKGCRDGGPMRVRCPRWRYHEETRRPLVCLVFILPLLIFYELGAIWLGGDAFRSGVERWLDQALQYLGFGQLVILPLVTIGVLIGWHHRNDDHWQVRPLVLLGMLLEAIGLGLILFWAANAVSAWGDEGGLARVSSKIANSGAWSSPDWWSPVVGFVGSGIYEELFFRIILLAPIVGLSRRGASHHKPLLIGGVVVVSLLFSAVHYDLFNPAGGHFEVSSFIFRFLASILFCSLFLFRGFGVAVGAHVAYDLLTQL